MIRNCWICLYDKHARMLDLHPPATLPWSDGDVIGRPATASIHPDCRDSFSEVFAHVLKFHVAVIWDGLDLVGIQWRAWLFPMRRPPKVAVASISRKWPAAVRKLTPRDRCICAALAHGTHSKEIAKMLSTTTSTIGNRRSQIARKLGLHPSALAGWCGLHEEWLS